MKRFWFLCTVGLGVALPACGSLDSNTNSAPTLATLQGSLLNPNSIDVSTSSSVRVAVVWRGGGPEQFSVAEDLPVQPVFPSAFTIALVGPPPASAMNGEQSMAEGPSTLTSTGSSSPSSGGPPPSGPDASFSSGAGEPGLPPAGPEGGAAPPDGGDDDAGAGLSPAAVPLDTPTNTSAEPFYAVGTVVAYLDENHNGKLDLVADDASAYVDQILASNQEMTIWYFQGPIPGAVSASGQGPSDGYNLLLDPPCNQPQVHTLSCPSAPVPDAGPCAPVQWLGMDTPYPLTVASSPEVASLMCLAPPSGSASIGSGMAPPYNPAIQPAQYPLPSDPSVCCASDGSNYQYTTCMEIPQGLCKGTLESCTTTGYERPTPAPAAWPCTN